MNTPAKAYTTCPYCKEPTYIAGCDPDKLICRWGIAPDKTSRAELLAQASIGLDILATETRRDIQTGDVLVAASSSGAWRSRPFNVKTAHGSTYTITYDFKWYQRWWLTVREFVDGWLKISR